MKTAILMATYNGESYLAEMLESIVHQSCQDFHCFIHDDGSKDGTISVAQKYQTSYSHMFTLLDGDKQGGACKNFMFLLRQVEADYYFFCDQDDQWVQDKVEKFVSKMREIETDVKTPALVFSDLTVVDSQLNVTGSSFLQGSKHSEAPSDYTFQSVLIRGKVPGCSMMINRALRDAMLNYKDINNIYMHDWWAMVLAYGSEGPVGYIPEATMKYRIHSNNTVGIHKKNAFHALLNPDVEKKKEWIRRPIHFAAEACSNEVVTSNNRSFCEEFVKISTASKLKRISFYQKHFGNLDRLWYMLLWV